ncbi:MAG: hypothetical protein IKQ55_09755 [Kiritimatiellae bacterium]|nr:hypothetical protein [Kiritimatiellia bacterium]
MCSLAAAFGDGEGGEGGDAGVAQGGGGFAGGVEDVAAGGHPDIDLALYIRYRPC